VALGALGVPLRPISHEANLFVPPDLARFTATADLILTAQLGEQVAEALGERNACMLVNHGIVVAAADVPTATVTAYLLDRACQMQLTAMAAGELASWSPPEESLAKREHCYSDAMLRGAWDYLVRRLDGPSDGTARGRWGGPGASAGPARRTADRAPRRT
jgi:L-fuculose-phosphate aldolase